MIELFGLDIWTGSSNVYMV